ncbi:MAG: hypothetical protein LUG44_04235 [Clostridiales bacterium]|nr:hypothetical protein [Clostridiales bacterium]
MTIQEITKALVEDKKLDRVQVEKVSPKIEALSPDIREALEGWLKTDAIKSPVYSGYDVNAILKAQPRLTVLAGYLTLDWLRRDPVAAKRSIEHAKHIIRIKK